MLALCRVRSSTRSLRSPLLSRLRPAAHAHNAMPQLANSTSGKKKPTIEHETTVDHQEPCKSGLDNDAASMSEAAYGEKTTPDEIKQHAEEESEKLAQSSNPLELSPAANDGSTHTSDLQEEARLSSMAMKEECSKKGTPTKHGDPKRFI